MICRECSDPIVIVWNDAHTDRVWIHACTRRWYCDGSQTTAEPEEDPGEEPREDPPDREAYGFPSEARYYH